MLAEPGHDGSVPDLGLPLAAHQVGPEQHLQPAWGTFTQSLRRPTSPNETLEAASNACCRLVRRVHALTLSRSLRRFPDNSASRTHLHGRRKLLGGTHHVTSWLWTQEPHNHWKRIHRKIIGGQLAHRLADRTKPFHTPRKRLSRIRGCYFSYLHSTQMLVEGVTIASDQRESDGLPVRDSAHC
jgi:hypothetical protein